MTDEVFLGLDLGTSSLKGVVVSPAGEILASARTGYETRRNAPGRAEQDPADWLRATAEVLRALAGTVAPEGWVGIGLTGMIPTLVLADDDGGAIGSAFTWEDDRANEEGAEFRAEHGDAAVYASTGQWVDGRYLLPMWRWIRKNERERAARATRVLSAKDFLFRWLTGETATDPSTATGFGCFDLASGTWSSDLAGDVVLRLPEVRPATATSPLSSRAVSELGLPAELPVVLGAADSVAGALALGVIEPGDCAYLWGTSTVILGVSREPLRDPQHRFLVTPLALGDAWGLEMDLVSTGSAIAWAATVLGMSGEDEVLRAAERSAPGANGVAFLPFLGSGEQGALWDQGLRGTISGLTLAHGGQDVARALLEGIALESRRCLDVLGDASLAPGELRATGGAAASTFFGQILADAASRPVTRPVVGDSAPAYGAALLAAAAIRGADPAPLARSREVDRLEPDPGAAPTWQALAGRHQRLLGAIRPLGGEGW